MTDARKSGLRMIMSLAWGAWRRAKQALAVKTFSDCLKGAWAMFRGLQQAARKFRRGGHVRLSHELIRSPIARANGRNSQADFQGAYLSAQFGQ
jgi:hypothetical protein